MLRDATLIRLVHGAHCIAPENESPFKVNRARHFTQYRTRPAARRQTRPAHHGGMGVAALHPAAVGNLDGFTLMVGAGISLTRLSRIALIAYDHSPSAIRVKRASTIAELCRQQRPKEEHP